VQNIDAAAMELWLSYRHYEAEINSSVGNNLGPVNHYNDLDMVYGGARIKF
jgi:hypothetical protein